ncbi:hypothetical protein DFH07DRAFT_954877 [Mycena maculata]|uniref:Uncharacterized protein n=1 Tax=Mycena maculata TaxID=230809 RepID=A0AAD7JPS2_9AGAR|nr:hypothetical protein DFH07DRAFT_954877 [Mycena maculata]
MTHRLQSVKSSSIVLWVAISHDDQILRQNAVESHSYRDLEDDTPLGEGQERGKTAVPVPGVHYPFPVSVEGSALVTPTPQVRERDRNVAVSRTGGGAVGQQMHTARAWDGGGCRPRRPHGG